MTMPVSGTWVQYNEGLGDGVTTAWVPAVVVMTNGDWATAGATDAGNGLYPRQPATNEVFVFYAGRWTNAAPQFSGAYTTQGTGIGQFQ